MTNAGQCLSSKAIRLYTFQVRKGGEFRSGEPFAQKWKVSFLRGSRIYRRVFISNCYESISITLSHLYATAVVLNDQLLDATISCYDLDTCATRVDRVL